MKSRRAPEPDLETLMPLLIGVWRRFRKESGPADKLQTREFRSVVASVKLMQEKFDSGKPTLPADYFSDPDLLSAYILYQWVLHYQQGLSLINELPIAPRRVLDVCSGPAPFAFAALKQGSHEVFALDQNSTALQLGGEICGRYGMALNVRKWNCMKDPIIPVEGKFDLIILGHCLDDLFPASEKNWPVKQHEFVNRMLNLLTPQGHLLIVDSSYIEANRRVLNLRDQLVKEGIAVQAPCVWRGECPALQVKNSPCYAQREFEKPALIKQIQRSAEINLGSLKMTYIIFKSPGAEWPQLPEKPLYRIISPPVESYQGKRYYLCGTAGKKTLGSHFTQHPPESRPFEYLRRGELISIEGALEKGNAFDIVKGTKIVVEAACGKPLPMLEEEE